MRLSFDDEESFKEAIASLCFNNPPSDPNSLELRRVGSSSSLPPQERIPRNEDICFDNSPSDPNPLGGEGSNTSTQPQERSEDIDIQVIAI